MTVRAAYRDRDTLCILLEPIEIVVEPDVDGWKAAEAFEQDCLKLRLVESRTTRMSEFDRRRFDAREFALSGGIVSRPVAREGTRNDAIDQPKGLHGSK